jgi:NADH:ubiquinone oxidoreductase subunit E
MSAPLTCTCGYRHRTDGCSEWSCIYHGEENRERSIEKRRACPVHEADEDGTLVRRKEAS